MTQYVMHGYEPGIYMEIYLPKRTIYQPFLFEVLTKGFELERVRHHFLSPTKRRGILNLLGRNPAWNNYDRSYVAQLKPFFHGYTMYEVDGVFKGSVPGTAAIVEERTQILRLIFRLDIEEFTAEAGVTAENPQVVRALICDYLGAHHRDQIIENSTGRDRQIYEAARRWRDQLNFFVFGYIVYELCARIEKLRHEKRIAKTEDEIWVTNFANIELDRILWSSGREQAANAVFAAPVQSPRANPALKGARRKRRAA